MENRLSFKLIPAFFRGRAEGRPPSRPSICCNMKRGNPLSAKKAPKGPLSKTMTPEKLEAVARRFQVLSDPLRLGILYHLGEGEKTVTELVELTGGTQSNISKHLGTLLNHGLVKRRREGTSAFYSVTEQSIFQLCDLVCGGIERTLDLSLKTFE